MSQSPWLFAFAVLLLLMPLWHGLWNRWREARRVRELHSTPASDWQADLDRHCPLYRRMPVKVRDTTLLLARQFEQEHRFSGCNGLAVTPLMRRLVSFQACALVHARGLPLYANLGDILLYPGEFIAPQVDIDEAGVVSESEQVLSGQSLDSSRVVLSWPDVLAAGADSDGYNVVIHECAHFLDHLLEGELSAPARGSAWHALLASEYQRLCHAVDAGEDTLIDPYGGEEPAEFFAVASETFMELSQELAARHPELYRALAEIYGFSPAGWPAAAADTAGSFTRVNSSAPATKNTTSDTMP